MRDAPWRFWRAPGKAWLALFSLLLSLPFYVFAFTHCEHGDRGHYRRGHHWVGSHHWGGHHGSRHHGGGSHGVCGHHWGHYHVIEWAFIIATLLVVLAIAAFYLGPPWGKGPKFPPLSRVTRFAKEQDIFLLRYSYRILGVLLAIGFIIISVDLYSSISKPWLVKKGDDGALDDIMRLFGAGLAATFLVWAGRQFERQLQQGRLEMALNYLFQARRLSGREQAKDDGRVKWGLLLLDDLPYAVLWDKRERIAALLKASGVTKKDFDNNSILKRGDLKRAMQEQGFFE